MLIVDASVVAAAILPDETSPLADAALSEIEKDGAIVPSHFWHEVRNLLAMSERRGRISVADTEGHLFDLRMLPIRVVADAGDLEILSITRIHGLTAYDAAYAALAVREAKPIATLDKAIRAAAASLAFELWTPANER